MSQAVDHAKHNHHASLQPSHFSFSAPCSAPSSVAPIFAAATSSSASEAFHFSEKTHPTELPRSSLLDERGARVLLDESIRKCEAGDAQGAALLCSQVLQAYPQSALAYVQRSRAYLCLGNLIDALYDADSAIKLAPTHHLGYLTRAQVCHRMGDMRHRQWSLEKALQIDPQAASAEIFPDLPDTSVLSVDDSSSAAHETTSSRQLGSSSNELDCVLCLKLLWEPVTTVCGHTFCRSCLMRALDHREECPLCRHVIMVNPDMPVSLLLRDLIRRNFPDEYAAREQEVESERRTHTASMPLFMLEMVLLPGALIPLRVFEARYRLMIRRCLEGGRRFGVVAVRSPTGGSAAAGSSATGRTAGIGGRGGGSDGVMSENALDPAEQPRVSSAVSDPSQWPHEPLGTTYEIEKIRTQPDGTYVLLGRGSWRFVVRESWEQDGYRVGKVLRFDDIPLEPCSEQLNQAQAIQVGLGERIRALLTVYEQQAGSEVVRRVLMRSGCPIHADGTPEPPAELVAFSFWCTAVLPFATTLQQKFIEERDTLSRLRNLDSILSTDVVHGSRCHLM